MKKDILLLANSVKHHKRCIAGKDIQTKEWIRLIGEDKDGIVNCERCLNKNEKCDFCEIKNIFKNRNYFIEPNILDIVQVSLLEKTSDLEHQTENYKIDTTKSWKVIGEKNKDKLDEYLDNPDYIFEDDSDRIKEENLPKNSLLLVEAKILKIYTIQNYQQRTQTRIKFNYNNFIYDLVVTDPRFYGVEKEDFQAYLTISLGELFYEAAYKLVANIIEI